MAKNPGDRYATAGELANEAHRALRGERIAALAPTQLAGHRSAQSNERVSKDRGPKPRRKLTVVVALVAASILAIAIGGVIVTRDRDRSPAEARTQASATPNATAASIGPATAAPADSSDRQNVQVIGFTQIGDDVSVRLHNPNTDAGLVRSPYEMTLLDQSGAIIATQGQGGLPGAYVNTIYQLPPDSDYGLRMTAPQGKTVASVELVTRGAWLDWNTMNSPSVTVTSPTIQDQSSTYGRKQPVGSS